jgi:hypothetical protein
VECYGHTANVGCCKNAGAVLPFKRTYLCSVNLVETSLHNCASLITEEGRGVKMAEKEKVKKSKMKEEGGREGEKREEQRRR